MRSIDADALKEEINKKKVVGRFNTLLLIDNAPTVDVFTFDDMKTGMDVGYSWGYSTGKCQRPQGECEKCDFRKFSETFVNGVVELMIKNGITSIEQLSEILKGGTE